MAAPMKRTLILIGLILGLFISSYFLMGYLKSLLPFPLGVDLIPRWVGTQAMLQGISPYSLEARQRIWLTIYGSSQTPQGNPFGFYYPPSISTLLMPFVLLKIPLERATVAWSALLWCAWLATLAILGQRMDRRLLVVFLLSGLLFRPAFSNYILGQVALLSVLAFGAAFYFARKEWFAIAGVFLALALLKPSFMVLPVLAFLFFFHQRRLLLAFSILTLLLILPAFMFLGWWIPGFIHELSTYALENQVAWSPALDILTPVGVVWLGISIALIVFGIIRRDIGLVLVSVLALNGVLVPHTADYDLVLTLGLLALLWAKRWYWAFFALLWFPWITLFLSPSIEMWYRFIWQVYPILILSLVGLEEYKNRRSLIVIRDQA
jgi:hypothetical protein